jgi:hypothetical protein
MAFAGRLILRGVVLGAALLAASALYSLVAGGWNAVRFADTAMTLGMFAMAFGALFAVGRGFGMGTHPQYQVARTAGATTGEQRASQDYQGGQPPVPFMLTLIAGGIVTLVVGALVRSLALAG